MHSVSEPDWKIEPRSISSSRRLTALVRLPLWAMAQPPMANSANSGCTSRSWVGALGAGGGIAHVADGEAAGQRLHQRGAR